MPHQTIHPKSPAEWRNWLAKNHDKESKVALIKWKKHTGKPTISHQEAMDEAICFGWIDTTIKRLDENRFIRHFAKRTKNSRWSNATLSYAKRLISDGKMHSSGMEAYKYGLTRPILGHGIPSNPEIPEELKKELDKKKNKKLKDTFNNYTPTQKTFFYRFILSAKQKATITKRVGRCLDAIGRGVKNPYY